MDNNRQHLNKLTVCGTITDMAAERKYKTIICTDANDLPKNKHIVLTEQLNGQFCCKAK